MHCNLCAFAWALYKMQSFTLAAVAMGLFGMAWHWQQVAAAVGMAGGGLAVAAVGIGSWHLALVALFGLALAAGGSGSWHWQLAWQCWQQLVASLVQLVLMASAVLAAVGGNASVGIGGTEHW
jgi:hypothetical protein